MSGCGESGHIMMDKVCDEVNEITSIKERFAVNVHKEIIKRDISEEKFRNAVELKIELPKFKGYDSDMDLYTFRTEFEKLVGPYVQRKLWSEVSKRNYLSGAALTLVNTIEDIDQIWMRLFKSFGNTNLLLRNKLGALEKLGGLWKAKGDEKI